MEETESKVSDYVVPERFDQLWTGSNLMHND